MKNALESLKAATFEVMETMFFLFPETVERTADLFQGPGLRAWIAVAGPRSFQVGLSLPVKMAQEMAANFLGLPEDEVPEDKLHDVVKEAANMVAGAFLTRQEVAPSFHLLPPEVQAINLENIQEQSNHDHLLFAVDDYGLEIFLKRKGKN